MLQNVMWSIMERDLNKNIFHINMLNVVLQKNLEGKYWSKERIIISLVMSFLIDCSIIHDYGIWEVHCNNTRWSPPSRFVNYNMALHKWRSIYDELFWDICDYKLELPRAASTCNENAVFEKSIIFDYKDVRT